jgi:uncharacterized membrane protein (DUF373 family)
MNETNKRFSTQRPTHEELLIRHEDRLIKTLHYFIRFAVRILAILMTFVILWTIADVVLVLYKRLMAPPFMFLNLGDILALFSTFLITLIGIEIFLNITLYIRKDIIPIQLVIVTALIAIARKIIVFDFNIVTPNYIYATAAVVVTLGITYWLVSFQHISPDLNSD